MGTEACADDELVKEKNPIIPISISKVAGGGIVDVIVLLSNHGSSPSIGPLTPDSNREINGEQEFDSSPDGNNSSETPKEALFDSFAPPGPDDNFVLAPPPPPQHKKYREESRIHVVRRLNFTNLLTASHESICDEEEHLFEVVYGTILDAIVSDQQQTKEVGGFDDGFGSRGTPKSAPRLCGIAETCPGAPMKSTSKYRNIDKEICKKLEF